MPYIAKRRLKVGEGYVYRGDPVPAENWKQRRTLLSMGWIKWVDEVEKKEDSNDLPFSDVEEQTNNEINEKETQDEIYWCEICEKTFKTERGFKMHYTKMHSKLKDVNEDG